MVRTCKGTDCCVERTVTVSYPSISGCGCDEEFPGVPLYIRTLAPSSKEKQTGKGDKLIGHRSRENQNQKLILFADCTGRYSLSVL